MDGVIILAGLFFLGDLLLARSWWRERAKRRKAERAANDAIREKYTLLDAIERRAAKVSSFRRNIETGGVA